MSLEQDLFDLVKKANNFQDWISAIFVYADYLQEQGNQLGDAIIAHHNAAKLWAEKSASTEYGKGFLTEKEADEYNKLHQLSQDILQKHLKTLKLTSFNIVNVWWPWKNALGLFADVSECYKKQVLPTVIF